MNTVHNARVMLLATALNNLGVGAIVTAIIPPVVNGRAGDLQYISVWLMLGVDLIAAAQAALGWMRT